MVTGTILSTKKELFDELHKVEEKLKDQTMKGWKLEGLKEYRKDIKEQLRLRGTR